MNRLKSLIITCLTVLVTALWGLGPPVAQALVTDTTGYYVPDYFNTPNWANSPPLAKFVDTLPGLSDTGIPIARPDTVTFPGSDYYEISLQQYQQQMHRDLPLTTLRGYVQVNNGTDSATGLNTVAPAPIRYLGPLILATKDRPVRIKFTNNLSSMGAGGELFIPVDTTIMGSGDFTIDYDPQTKAPITQVSGVFPQNRATLHLHGGLNPWISDGTAHQWTAPAGEPTVYPKGVSAAYVPDMWFDASGNLIPNSATCTQGTTTCTTPGATNNPGPGKLSFYWTNDQSARFMFYHDHAYGITRLNVYVGEAAGYLINDAALEDQLASAGVPGTLGTTPDLAHLVPLVIQDKTFVNATTIMTTDPTWAWGSNPAQPATLAPVTGDLWWPHVYMPAQNPFNPNLSGINDMGRWHYGPWFFPGTPLCFASGGTDPEAVKPYCIDFPPVLNEYYDSLCDPYGGNTAPNAPIVNFCQPPERPGTHNPSWGAEAFLDTMVVNGAAYPTLTVNPEKYRFRILNAAHDRFLNLQLYKASNIVGGIIVDIPGASYTNPVVTIVPALGDPGRGATATATVDPATGAIIAITLDTVGSGYLAAPTVQIADLTGIGAAATAALYTAPTEVGMVPAAMTAGFPATWPTDGREGGVPDPATRGPAFMQIATEGGVLPAPVVLPTQPVQWNMDPTMFNVGNVLNQRDGGGTLLLAPAERADVIVDFSQFAGQTLIIYNDAPTAFPALDPHYDYYTGAPDRTDIGGYGPVLPGVGPNVRTVMQIVVGGAGGAATPDHYDPALLTSLQTAFASTVTTQGLFAQTQHPLIVGQRAYGSSGNSAYYTAGTDCDPTATVQPCFPPIAPYWGLSDINSTSLSYDTVLKDQAGAISFQRIGTDPLNPPTPFQMKAIHDEMGATFDNYGRMSAKLGLEVPFTNAAIQNFILQNFVDPVTEIVNPDEVQIWRITHNGVDTHPIHFHLFDVQLVNRVGWDGFKRLPDENEMGFKDTLRISPLEDTIVALRPVRPPVPFRMPNSFRPLNPTQPLGSMMDFSQIDPTTGADIVPSMTNQMINMGFEYTWHCHILSHEENDMMRVTSFAVPPEDPSGLVAVLTGSGVNKRAVLTWVDNSLNETGFTVQRSTNGAFTGALTSFNLGPNITTFTNTIGNTNQTFYYRVFASNTVGGPAPYPIVTADSGFSNTAGVNQPPTAPTTVSATAFRFNTSSDRVTVTWTDTSNNETGFRIQRAADAAFTLGVATSTVGANVQTFTTGNLPRGATFYFRVQSFNASGTSAYENAANNPIITP